MNIDKLTCYLLANYSKNHPNVYLKSKHHENKNFYYDSNLWDNNY